MEDARIAGGARGGIAWLGGWGWGRPWLRLRLGLGGWVMGYGVLMEMWLLWDGRCDDSGDVEDDKSK